MITRWAVVHVRSGRIVGTYSSERRARRALDKHDNEYGGYAHAVIAPSVNATK